MSTIDPRIFENWHIEPKSCTRFQVTFLQFLSDLFRGSGALHLGYPKGHLEEARFPLGDVFLVQQHSTNG